MNREEIVSWRIILQILKETGYYNLYTKEIDNIVNCLWRVKKQKEVIDKAIKKINDYKIYCKENKGFTKYTDIKIEAIEPILIKMEDILKEVSE